MCVFPWTGDTWSFFRSWLFFHMNVLWNVVNTCRHNTMFFPNGLQTGQPAECSRSFSTCKHRCWQSQTGFWWVATHGWPAVLKWQLGIQRGCPTGTGTLYNCTRATGGQLCDISPQWHRNVKGSHGGEWSSSHLGWDSIYMMCIWACYNTTTSCLPCRCPTCQEQTNKMTKTLIITLPPSILASDNFLSLHNTIVTSPWHNITHQTWFLVW